MPCTLPSDRLQLGRNSQIGASQAPIGARRMKPIIGRSTDFLAEDYERREAWLTKCKSTVKIGAALFLWMSVILAANHTSESPVVFGRYSWRYAAVLGVLAGAAGYVSFAKPTWFVKLWYARVGVLLSCLSLLVGLCFAEFIVRALDLYGVSYYESVGDYMRNMKADPHLIYRHKPLSQHRYGEVTLSYNENGLRDRQILPKAKDEMRILALGDSVTLGWGVPQDQIFTSRLEELLASRLRRKVRLINGGVGGYNTVQETAFLKHEGITYEPDLVMLTYVENDIEETPSQFSFGVRPPPQSLTAMIMTKLQRAWLYRLVYHMRLYGLQRDGNDRANDRGQGWADSMSAIDELVSICEERSIKLIIFYYRYGVEPGNTLLQDVVLHGKGVRVKDIGEWFAGRDISTLIVSKVDSHPNAVAHRLMAEHMAAEIDEILSAGK